MNVRARLSRPSLPLRVLLGACLPLAISPAATSQAAAVGERVPDFEFHELVGHDGRTRLSELRGRPVLIAGWRAHMVEGIHAARVVVEIWQKHRDDVVLILLDRDKWQRSGGAPGWVGAVSFWQVVGGFVPWVAPGAKGHRNGGLPILRTAPDDLRSMVLIGADGTLLAEGSAENTRDKERPTDLRVRIKKLVDAEVQKVKRGWGRHKAAVEARRHAFGKGHWQTALEVLDRARQEVPAEGASQATAELAEARQEIESVIRGHIRSARFLLDQGRCVDAAAAIRTLRSRVAGLDHAEEVAALAEELDSAPGKRETALDKKLRRIVAPAQGQNGRGSIALIGMVKLLAEQHPDTRVGRRAAGEFFLYKSLVSRQLGLRYDKLSASLDRWLERNRR